MIIRDEDLKLIEQATAVNRQHFTEAIRLRGGVELSKKLRVRLGMPESGFSDSESLDRYLYPNPPGRMFERSQLVQDNIG